MFRLRETFLINFDADRDHSFEGIINSHGINSWGNSEEGATVFVLRLFVCELLREMNLLLIGTLKTL